MRGEYVELLAGQCIPENDPPVVAGRCQDAAVGRIVDGSDPVGVAGKFMYELAVGEAPNADVMIVAGGCQPLSAPMNADGRDHGRLVVIVVGRQLHHARRPTDDATFTGLHGSTAGPNGSCCGGRQASNEMAT